MVATREQKPSLRRLGNQSEPLLQPWAYLAGRQARPMAVAPGPGFEVTFSVAVGGAHEHNGFPRRVVGHGAILKPGRLQLTNSIAAGAVLAPLGLTAGIPAPRLAAVVLRII